MTRNIPNTPGPPPLFPPECTIAAKRKIKITITIAPTTNLEMLFMIIYILPPCPLRSVVSKYKEAWGLLDVTVFEALDCPPLDNKQQPHAL